MPLDHGQQYYFYSLLGTTAQRDNTCRNNWKYCNEWAGAGLCRSSAFGFYMSEQCCEACQGTKKVRARTI